MFFAAVDEVRFLSWLEMTLANNVMSSFTLDGMFPLTDTVTTVDLSA